MRIERVNTKLLRFVKGQKAYSCNWCSEHKKYDVSFFVDAYYAKENVYERSVFIEDMCSIKVALILEFIF